ncbi:MAG: hypothetical protein J6F31_07510 [Oscillospiraceae bacterium]|nr:hypothetical protein [Oscillospiraceae bacterium]
MFFYYYSKNYSSTATVNYGVKFRCPFCGAEIFYKGSIVTKATKKAPYGIGSDTAAARAQKQAGTDIRETVRNTAEALKNRRFEDSILRGTKIACEHCGRCQPWADYPRDMDCIDKKRVISCVIGAIIALWVVLSTFLNKLPWWVTMLLCIFLSIGGAVYYVMQNRAKNRKKREEADEIMASADFETPAFYVKTGKDGD